MLDLRRLSYFLAVAGERSFTRASERLHIAQPALSRQVRLLEEELGAPLLVRGGQEGVTTTPAGALLAERAPTLLEQLQELWEEAERVGGGARDGRLLRLGYAASSGYETAARIVSAVRQHDDGIQVRARVMCVADALDGLRAGTLDAALLRQPPAAGDLSSTLVRRELQGVLLHEDHPQAADEVVAWSALRELPIAIHPRDANPGRYDAIVAACRAAGFEPQIDEPLIAFDPSHQTVADGSRVTIVSHPGTSLPSGLRWRPLAPSLILDVRLVAPLVGQADGVATLVAAARRLAAERGWLEHPRPLTSAPLRPVAAEDPDLRASA